MNTVIRLSDIDRADPWQRLSDTATTVECPAGHFLVSLPALTANPGANLPGLWLEPDTRPADLRGLFKDVKLRASELPLIAIHFPAFTDGRGYSLARLLRDELCYAGEIRAVGAVPLDSLLPLYRSGFNSWTVKEDPREAPTRKTPSPEQAFDFLQNAVRSLRATQPYQGAARFRQNHSLHGI